MLFWKILFISPFILLFLYIIYLNYIAFRNSSIYYRLRYHTQGVHSQNITTQLNNKLILFVIIVFAIAIRFYFFIGFNFFDDQDYVMIAKMILDPGPYVGQTTPQLRLGIVYPLAWSFYLFGFNNFALIFYPMVCSVGGILLAFFLGKTFFNSKAGLLSAGFISFFPLDIIFSTVIHQDVPLSFFAALGITFFLIGVGEIGLRWRNKKLGRLFFFFMAGICTGVAYLIKVPGLIVLSFPFFYLIYSFITNGDKKRFLKNKMNYVGYCMILVGFLAVFSLESCHYKFLTGDWLHRFSVVWKYELSDADVAGYNQELDFYPKKMFLLNDDLMIDPEGHKYDNYYGFFFYFTVAGIMYVLFRRKHKIHIFLIWIFVFFLVLQFGTMSLTQYIPLHRLQRHLSVIIIPSAVILGAMYSDKSNPFWKWIRLVSYVFLLVSSVYFTHFTAVRLHANTSDIREVYNFLKTKDMKTIYADGGTREHLRFFFGFQKDDYFRHIIEMDCNTVRDAYVLVDSDPIVWYQGADPLFDEPSRGCLKNIPAHWKLIMVFNNNEYRKKFLTGYHFPRLFYVPS